MITKTNKAMTEIELIEAVEDVADIHALTIDNDSVPVRFIVTDIEDLELAAELNNIDRAGNVHDYRIISEGCILGLFDSRELIGVFYLV